ncbi:alanine--tRNA ligase [Candidatus Woesearchaeota archaeon]|jgi:alanyl-tRNA synthetase|nr:alanine--tRNA ligase [Candidatus Woesearchaeota archaeon]MBT5397532.1 alanine--tRNA ligase [Candidatus Woesearchaeota archaeon]MBT6367895.1 alanine--tRNA ligase [Candidatus Woesearchaeota archaeon]
MKAKELKKKYLDFFKSKGHAIIPSAPLIPEHDPSVLFTTAGMHPLVPFLVGQVHPLGNKVASVQKCMRTGDIDEVGDSTHNTFFEMLGNWSFGDYFKEEAIAMSFEFLTRVLKIPLSHLAVTCFIGDEDAPRDETSATKWKQLGISTERIAFLDKEDNWWGPAGSTGPCGPDSEMFYWVGKDKPPKEFDTDDDRWVEIWNDVFMEYNKTQEGKYVPLSQKNVDTGLGVERVTAILQGKDEIYQTELFLPIIRDIERITKKKYEDNTKAMRIIADHMRASVFILGDERGAVPSNVDQGYILRRFIRRAIRHLKSLGVKDINTSIFAEKIIDMYKDEYPLLEEKRNFILDELHKEEERFTKTLEMGLRKFETMTAVSDTISGKDAFLLFQSYGFPIEMTRELAEEKGVSVAESAFAVEFEKHQELSRVGAEKKFKGGLSDASEETTRLHTATHLLNEALKTVLKTDIRQKGSNITAERLRFDFNFDRKLTSEELQAVEDEVNRVIQLQLDVEREEMSLEDALASGAHGEFGAKYPAKVSVYSVGDYSKEICMGPHVKNTSELGTFKIKKEQSISAGTRRIKAVLLPI